ncbi:MAG: hypothetical protein QME12_02520 [Nanoarchaeota archaeon]|nr:hypothetical protein [Nanoarchaeota archaeon]
MAEIGWCIRKKDGPCLVEPNANLAEGYLIKAENAIGSARTEKVPEWKIAKAYYSMYFALYAVLQRIGIKCEIHACTLAFAGHFLKDYFNEDELALIQDAMAARLDSQYYVNREVPDEQSRKILESAPPFIVKCKCITDRLDENKILDIRQRFKAEAEKAKKKI